VGKNCGYAKQKLNCTPVFLILHTHKEITKKLSQQELRNLTEELLKIHVTYQKSSIVKFKINLKFVTSVTKF